MQKMWMLIALAGCASDDGGSGGTLGSGTLEQVTWSGGLCQRRWDCVGTLDMGPAGFQARFIDNGEVVATGELAPTTIDELDARVADIPSDTPVGTYQEDGGDGAVWEFRVRYEGELRYYLTKSSLAQLSVYFWDVKDAVATCTPGTLVKSFSSCTPSR